MTARISPEEEDRLTAQALALADDMRGDLAAAHRTVRYLDRTELENLALTLAAMVPTDMPLSQLAWWRHFAPTDARDAA